jgi:hypothetical protein
MASKLIKEHLEELKSQKKFDDGFIAILAEANKTDEDGDITAERILDLIKQRHAKNKENKT